LILGFVALPLLSKFGNGFIYDDIAVIVESDFIHDPSNIPAAFFHHTMVASSADGAVTPVDTYRPVTLLTFFWDAQWSGRSTFSYHFTNLVLHLACVALLFFLVRRLLATCLGGDDDGDEAAWAGFAALFFGVSPWISEGHVWINGRSDPLCTFFGLAAVLLFQRSREVSGWPRGAGLVGAAVLFLAGLLSKEVLILVLPALVFLPGSSGRVLSLGHRLRAMSGFLVAAALYLGVRTYVLSGMQAFAGQHQLYLATSRLPVLLLDGLVHLLVPTPPYLRSLAEDYGGISTPLLVAALVAVVVVALAAFRFRKEAPLIPVGLLLFALTLAPAAIIATMSWGGFGRYLYLPAIGVALALVGGGRLLLRRDALASGGRVRRLLTLGLGGYVAALALVLALTVGTFRDQETFYLTAIENAPEHALGYSLLAAEYQRLERFAEARALYERATSLDPTRPKYAASLAAVLLGLGEPDRARAVAEDALRQVPPRAAGPFRVIVIGSVFTTEPEVAVRQLLTCLAEQPGFGPCRRWAWTMSNHPEISTAYQPLLSAATEGRGGEHMRVLLREIAAGPRP